MIQATEYRVPKPPTLLQTLDKNAHIPGYQGHCPKIGEVVGQRFSESSKISYLMHKTEQNENDFTARDKLVKRHNTITAASGNRSPAINDNHIQYSYSMEDLPSYNNFNRYTKNMIIGYSGFIPNQAHGFGKSYTETTNMRLKKHFNTLEQNKNKKAENKMADTTLGCKRLKEMAVSPHTGIFNDHQRFRQPIKGYQGHVPRRNLLESSVGTDELKATRDALDIFRRQHQNYITLLDLYQQQQPVTCQCK